MTTFEVSDWREQLRQAERGNWKEGVYRWIRPILDARARRHLDADFLRELHVERVLPERGFPRIARQRFAIGDEGLSGKTLLVQGTGNGWDAASWARFHPARILATDLYPFDSWEEVASFTEAEHGVRVEFSASPLESLSFVADEEVDLIVSDAVYEHVVELERALAESRRVLRTGGALYATYGPLWYSAGGDHFSGRGGLAEVFNHLLLARDEYRGYFEENKWAVEDFQSGGRYVELDLFSRLATREYVRLFSAAGFVVERIWLELSGNAIAFRARYPDRFAALEKLHPGRSSSDFLTKANTVRLRKKESATEIELAAPIR